MYKKKREHRKIQQSMSWDSQGQLSRGLLGFGSQTKKTQMDVLLLIVSSEKTTLLCPLAHSFPGRMIQSLQSRSGTWREHQRPGFTLRGF